MSAKRSVKSKSSLNKKGLGKLAIILIIIGALFVAYAIYDLSHRGKSPEQTAEDQKRIAEITAEIKGLTSGEIGQQSPEDEAKITSLQNELDILTGKKKSLLAKITSPFASLGGIIGGFFTAAGVGPLTWTDHGINFLAIIVATILLGIWIFLIAFAAPSFLSPIPKPGTTAPTPKTPLERAIAASTLALFILLATYVIVAWIIPFLRPILAPLLSDYGTQISTSYHEFVNPFAKYFGKETVQYPGAFVGIRLIFVKGFVLSIYVLLLYLILRAPELFFKWIFRAYYGVKGAKIKEAGKVGTMEAVGGVALSRAMYRQAAAASRN